MAIRWNASAVAEKCDEAEKILAGAMPTIERAASVLAEIAKMENVPQYIESPAGRAESSVKHCANRARQDIDQIRSHIPAAEIAKTRFKGKTTTLGLEVKVLPKEREYRPSRAYSGYVGTPPVQDGTRQTTLALR